MYLFSHFTHIQISTDSSWAISAAADDEHLVVLLLTTMVLVVQCMALLLKRMVPMVAA
jgi:hypothetical protein